MADNIKFELVSPEKLLVSEEVAQVVVPGTEGDFAVLPGHAPVLSTMKPGVISITREGGQEDRIFVRGGFAEVNPDGLIVLAEQAIPLSELDAERLGQEIQNAEEDIADAKDDDRRRRAQESLDHLKQLQQSL